MKKLVVPFALLSVFAVGEAVAHAQITQEKATKSLERSLSTADVADFEVENEGNGNYSVKFQNEAIDATLNDGSIPRIIVRPVRGYGQLARPRLHFVPELLKSVEFM